MSNCFQQTQREYKKIIRNFFFYISSLICIGHENHFVDVNWLFVIIKSYVKVDFKERNNNNNKITVHNVVELAYKVFDYA